MNFLIDLFYEIPDLKGYGLFHLSFVFLTLVFIALFIKIGLSHNDKTFRITILCFGIMFLVLEILVQIYHNRDNDSYDWGLFPFQLCSTPIYFCLIVPLLPKKAREFAYPYGAFYLTIAGISVLVNPGSVIVPTVIVSARSLFWHGAMVVLGFYIITVKRYGKKVQELLPGLLIFIGAVGIATGLNVVYEHFRVLYDLEDGFNMMYISPYEESVLDFLNNIKDKTGWFFVLLTYLFGVSLGAFVIWLFPYLIRIVILKWKTMKSRKLKYIFAGLCISFTLAVISLIIYFSDFVIKYLDGIANYFLSFGLLLIIVVVLPLFGFYFYLQRTKKEDESCPILKK